MKKLISLLFFVISISAMSQTENDTTFYKGVIDYDGFKKRNANWSGYWTCSDSTITHFSDGTKFEYKIEKKIGRNVEYTNDWGDAIRVTFMNNGVVKRNSAKPEQYMIFQIKK